ncbi:hypothetical protein C2S52_000668, partial [Perilla frutescens var. hirtella]
ESSPQIKTLLERVSSLERIIQHLRSCQNRDAILFTRECWIDDELNPAHSPHVYINNSCEMYTSAVESWPHKTWTFSSNEEFINDRMVSVVYNTIIREGYAETGRSTIVTRSLRGQTVGPHDPRDLEIAHLLLNKFKTWQKYSSSKLGADTIDLSTGIATDVAWFIPIWGRGEWLRHDIADPFLQVPLTSELFDVVFQKVVPFSLGHYPINYPVEWRRVKRICGVGNIAEHWVAYEVSLEGQCIKVYDPLSTSNLWEPISKLFHIMAHNIPKLLRHLRIWDMNPMSNPLQSVWDVIQVRHPPQQRNNYDCRIMVIKYLECLLCGADLLVLDGARCGIYWRTYCAHLYEISCS